MGKEMILAIIIILTMYIIWLLTMIVGWMRIRTEFKKSSDSNVYYSIIVPFRNEVNNLSALLNSLSKLNCKNYEVILVNDHSDDDSVQLLNDGNTNYQLLHLPENELGKKAALTMGIDAAKGDIIVTTDADCEHHPDWLQVFDYYFEELEAKMVFGGIAFETNGNFFSRLQQTEFATLIGAGAASLAFGFPIMCNGANLAFRKSAFVAVGGYKGNEHIASGDDEFLLTKIGTKYPSKVYYAKHSNSVVTTKACSSIRSFFNQRKRWSSKWSANSKGYKSMLAILIFLSSIATIISIFLLIDQYQPIIIMLLGIKFILDGIFIALVLKSLRRPFSIFIYLTAQILYPIYTLVFGIAANFGKYQWKGRSH